jgi:Protein of unknown function (DUF2971)
MNDHREGRWLSSVIARQEPEYIYLLRFMIDRMQMPYFASCFSGDGDRLSQWRGYADQGRGVAIGFSKRAIADAIKISDQSLDRELQFPALVEITYTCRKIDKNPFIVLLRDMMKAVSKVVKGDGPQSGSLQQMPFGLAKLLAPLEAVFKNGEFDEEGEWRAVLRRNTAQHFQFRQDDIVPYIPIPIGGFIRAICIGPRSRVSEADLSGYLRAHLGIDIKVCKSKATLQ